MPSLPSLLIFSLLPLLLLAQVCVNPQKSFYLSFQALSKRDSLPSVFIELTTTAPNYTASYANGGTSNYTIRNLAPGLYYSQHYQTEEYVSKYVAKVSLGTLSIGMRFDFDIVYMGKTKSGTARLSTHLDRTTFTKSFKISDGYLQCDPVDIQALSLTQMLTIETASTSLTLDETEILQQMLNDRVGTNKLKTSIMTDFNNKYPGLLKKHLNNEQLISSNNFTYTYGTTNLEFSHLIKDFELSNDSTKGLESFLMFGLSENNDTCVDLPKEFDEATYGGIQELISLPSALSAFRSALTKGLANLNLTRSWEVPAFQFYMGDLANSVPFANNFPSDDPFNVSCQYDSARPQVVKLDRYQDNSLYINLPLKISIQYKAKEVLTVTIDLTFVVRLVAREKDLRVVVDSTGVSNFKSVSVDPSFVVKDEYLARFSISQVLNGLVRRQVFGTGFPIIYRRYPAVRVPEDKKYLVIFDLSQK